MAATKPPDVAARPAFYALAPGGWRDYATLLHLPYTAWHLSYVTIGAALAPTFDGGRYAATMLAFFLAVGIGAHVLDELIDRPLQTGIPAPALIVLAAISIGGAVAIGLGASIAVSPWIAAFVVAGAFILVAYNLELWNGVFHNDLWFGLAWGGFPVLCGYFAQAETLGLAAVLAAAFATALALAQRQLSTSVRHLRRRVRSVRGDLEEVSGATSPITRESLTAPAERALQLLAVATIALAAALLVTRVT